MRLNAKLIRLIESAFTRIVAALIGSSRRNAMQCPSSREPLAKRNRKCPSCRQPIVWRQGNALTTDQAADFDRRQIQERIAECRRQNVVRFKELQQQWRDKIINGVEIMATHDNGCCDYCDKQDGKRIAMKALSVEMLPPFAQCTSEHGCRCAYSATTVYSKR